MVKNMVLNSSPLGEGGAGVYSTHFSKYVALVTFKINSAHFSPLQPAVQYALWKDPKKEMLFIVVELPSKRRRKKSIKRKNGQKI